MVYDMIRKVERIEVGSWGMDFGLGVLLFFFSYFLDNRVMV